MAVTKRERKQARKLMRRFVRDRVRRRRLHYPIRRRFGFRRRFVKRRWWSLRRRVLRTYNRPILVRFFHSREEVITSDEYVDSFTIGMSSFNNDLIRQQLYGYVELFDQFKIVKQELNIHFKTTAEWTDLNTNIPEVFWAYDYDIKKNKIDLFNIQKLQNFHHMLLPPLRRLRLGLRPRWTDNRLVVVNEQGQKNYLDTQSGVRRVDNPWLDTKMLSMNGGQAPDITSMNGFGVVFKNAHKRSFVVHSSIYVMFRGRKNNQSYVTPNAAA